MNSGEPIELQDVLIAGIVMSRNEELVTNNIKHFKRILGSCDNFYLLKSAQSVDKISDENPQISQIGVMHRTISISMTIQP